MNRPESSSVVMIGYLVIAASAFVAFVAAAGVIYAQHVLNGAAR